MNRSIPHNNCTGCGLCREVCPRKCIQMVENTEGFLYPKVNDDFCIKCSLCEKMCPEGKDDLKYRVDKVYAAKSKNENRLQNSTSGGIFGEIALKTIQAGGTVYGAAYMSCDSIKHIRIDNAKDLSKLNGSKYVQSQVFQIFENVKEDLENKRSVLFSGTGCQIAALRGYLRKQYDLLTCVEVVCHGVPAPGVFREYIKWLADKCGEPVISYQFRSKYTRPTGEHSVFSWTTRTGKKTGYAYEDPFYGSFLNGTILRKSCYNCNYKGEYRTGDITLGDFWGVEKTGIKLDSNHGLSLVMVNSENGITAFKSIRNEIDYCESDFELAIHCNPSIKNSANCNLRKIIDCKSPELFSSDLVVKCTLKNKIKSRMPWYLKKVLKRIL